MTTKAFPHKEFLATLTANSSSILNLLLTINQVRSINMYEITVQLPFNGFHVNGVLSLPVQAKSLIIFSQGFRNSLFKPLEQILAQQFNKKGFGTLHLDLLDQNNELPKDYKNIELLSHGLATSTKWLHGHSEYQLMDLAYFGSGIGAAAALNAAGKLGNLIKTVVSFSGSLNLPEQQLLHVSCPVLLIVGELDSQGLTANKEAMDYLQTTKKLIKIPKASHLFKESGKAIEAASVTTHWFKQYLSHAKQSSLLY